jgi:hypothetical protein
VLAWENRGDSEPAEVTDLQPHDPHPSAPPGARHLLAGRPAPTLGAPTVSWTIGPLERTGASTQDGGTERSTEPTSSADSSRSRPRSLTGYSPLVRAGQ